MRSTTGFLAGILSLALGSLSTAHAQINFSNMQVGCSWTTRYSDGTKLTETFVGTSSGKFKTNVTAANNPKAVIRHSFYDAKGRLVRKDWAGGKWEKFSPYSCFDVPGSCTYRYTNADGTDQTIKSETMAKGKGFNVVAGPIGGPNYPNEYFELGELGLITKNKASNYSAQLIALTNCGAES